MKVELLNHLNKILKGLADKESSNQAKAKESPFIIDVTASTPSQIPKSQRTYGQRKWSQVIDVDNLYYYDYFSDDLNNLAIEVLDYAQVRLVEYYHGNARQLEQVFKQGPYSVNDVIEAIYRYARESLVTFYNEQQIHSSYYNPKYVLARVFPKAAQVYLNESISEFIKKMPVPNENIRHLFHLTTYGTRSLWWDVEGELRASRQFSQQDLNIMHATPSRTTVIWKSEEMTEEMLVLYLDIWRIISDGTEPKGPTRSKVRNEYFAKLISQRVSPWAERKQYRILSSLLKVTENTIRKKNKQRLINVTADIENIQKRFRKSVSELIFERFEQTTRVEPVMVRKKIVLNQQKIDDSHQALLEVVNLVGNFVETDEESMPKESQVIQAKPETTHEAPDIMLAFITQLSELGELALAEVDQISKSHGMLLNAFINRVNESLYDLLEDQGVIIEDGMVKIDEYYIEDIKDYLSS